MIEQCATERNTIQTKIEEIQNRKYSKLIASAGEEKKVKYNIDEVWEDYLFALQGVLYRWDICFNKLKQILGYLQSMNSSLKEVDLSERVFIGAPFQCDELSYEFESLLVAFAKLYEEPLLVEISRYISRNEQKMLRECCPRRDDENGLFWEINLLRNRAAHSTPGFYSSYNDYAARYMSISSKMRIEYYDNKFIFNTTLLSLRKNPYIKKVIKEKIIQENSQVPLLELLLGSTTPKGRGKKNPQVLFMGNVGVFDLNEEFLELSLDMFKLMEGQLGVFDRCI